MHLQSSGGLAAPDRLVVPAESTPASPAVVPPPTIDDFEALGVLGHGGSAEVVLVRHSKDGRLFALKVVSKAALGTTRAVQRVVDENTILQTIVHPYIVRLHYAFQDSSHFFLALDFLGGGDLFSHLQSRGPLGEEGARLVLAQITLALEHLHREHGVIYRDLKPENVVLGLDGHAVLADFGTAKRMTGASTSLSLGPSTRTQIGTPEYMAPEVLQGAAYSFAVDWWSAGVLLYELLVGQHPWGSGTHAGAGGGVAAAAAAAAAGRGGGGGGAGSLRAEAGSASGTAASATAAAAAAAAATAATPTAAAAAPGSSPSACSPPTDEGDGSDSADAEETGSGGGSFSGVDGGVPAPPVPVLERPVAAAGRMTALEAEMEQLVGLCQFAPPSEAEEAEEGGGGGALETAVDPAAMPRSVPPAAAAFILKLLRVRPEARLGGSGRHGGAHVRADAFFAEVDWAKLLLREIASPLASRQGGHGTLRSSRSNAGGHGGRHGGVASGGGGASAGGGAGVPGVLRCHAPTSPSTSDGSGGSDFGGSAPGSGSGSGFGGGPCFPSFAAAEGGGLPLAPGTGPHPRLAPAAAIAATAATAAARALAQEELHLDATADATLWRLSSALGRMLCGQTSSVAPLIGGHLVGGAGREPIALIIESYQPAFAAALAAVHETGVSSPLEVGVAASGGVRILLEGELAVLPPTLTGAAGADGVRALLLSPAGRLARFSVQRMRFLQAAELRRLPLPSPQAGAPPPQPAPSVGYQSSPVASAVPGVASLAPMTLSVPRGPPSCGSSSGSARESSRGEGGWPLSHAGSMESIVALHPATGLPGSSADAAPLATCLGVSEAMSAAAADAAAAAGRAAGFAGGNASGSGSGSGGSLSGSGSGSKTLSGWELLLHVLQRERGVTCAWVASGGSLAYFGKLVVDFRAKTDAAGPPPGMLHRLILQREAVDAEVRRATIAPAADSSTDAAAAAAVAAAVAAAPPAADSPARPAADAGADGTRASVFYNVLRAYSSLCEEVLLQSERQVLLERTGSTSAASIATFARLKESTAYMRGFLTGIVALPEDQVGLLPSRAFADLVVCVSNQRAYQESLQASAPPPLLVVMADGFNIENAELAEAHWQLVSDFNLKALRSAFPGTLGVQRCWDLYTEHVDKLHAIEAALLEHHHEAEGEAHLYGPSSYAQEWAAAAALPPEGAPAVGTSTHSNGSLRARAARASREQESAELVAATAALRQVAIALQASEDEGAASGAGGAAASLAASAAAAPLAETIAQLPAALLKRALLELLAAPASPASEPGGGAPPAEATGTTPPQSRRLHPTPAGSVADSPRTGRRRVPHGTAAAALASSGAGGAAARPLPTSGWAGSGEDGLTDLSAEHWRISLDELVLHRRIGGGAMGATYLAAWEGVGVAVKVASTGGGGMAGWRAEVAALTRLRHPNIVRILGAAAAAPTYCLVLEYCDGGDVRQALNQPTPPGFFWSIAEGVATGMAYLHRKGVMHRDLKCSNVLLESNGLGVRITDFGLATHVEGRAAGAVEVGTFRWMAPEIARREAYSTSADVYSYAMVLFELITHEVPFAAWEARQAAAAVALHALRPTLPEATPQPLRDLLNRCWDHTPTVRPRFDEIIPALAAARAALTAEQLAWLNAPEGHALPLS